jgi:gliding motility-associated-like protein
MRYVSLVFNMRISLRFLFLLILLGRLFAHGVEGGAVFVENRNQWHERVRFRADIPGGALFLEQDRFTYAFGHAQQKADIFQYYYNHPPRYEGMPFVSPLLDCHAFSVKFINASPNVRWEGKDKDEAYRNYFLGKDPQKWAGGVPAWHEVTGHNLYAGTDVILGTRNGKLKYDFIVEAGFNPQVIALGIEGASSVELDPAGNLKIFTSVNELTELAPEAWQIRNGEKVPVACRFHLNGNVVGFEFPEGYDATLDLIIDPVLVFSTFSGSLADNFGFTATYDTAGNLYSGGNVYALGFPVTVGAYQTAFAGGAGATAYDVAILKYNPGGTGLIYATYLGGFGGDQPHSMYVNGNDELVVMGTTEAGDFPVTVGAYDLTHNGGFDIFVSKFNPAGTALLASTYVGGTADDGINAPVLFSLNPGFPLHFQYADEFRGDVNTDIVNEIYVASCTRSPDFPTTAGAFQTVFNGGAQDGCVFKLDANLSSLTWSSYLGGSGEDAAYSLGLTPTNTLYVSGGTSSLNFPVTPGALAGGFLGGQADGFVVQFSATGNTLLNATYIGTPNYDQAYFVQLSLAGDVYISGQSSGGTFPVVGTVYTNANSGQFIAELDPNLSTIQLSTVFGTGSGAPDLSPSAFLVDKCGYVYFSGWGGFLANSSTIGLPVTPNAFQNTTDGNDFYLIVLDPGMSGLFYASIIGGGISQEHVDGGTSRFDKDGIVYQSVCGGCGGNSDFPTTPGAWSNTNNSVTPMVNCNNAAFKFDFQVNPVNASLSIAPSTSGCAPFTVNFSNSSSGALNYEWDFGDNSPLLYSANASHTFVNAGTYTVRLIATDPTSCNVTDTAYATITVRRLEVYAGGDTIVCAGNNNPFPLTVVSNCVICNYQWQPANLFTNSTIANPQVTVNTSTSFTVTVQGSLGPGCPLETFMDTVYVDVLPAPFVTLPPDTFSCDGSGGVLLSSLTTGGVTPYTYVWTPQDGSLSDANITNPVANPDTTTTYYFYAVGFNGCRSNTDSVTVTVHPLPVADAGTDLRFCEDAPGVFLMGSIQNPLGSYSVRWLPSTGLFCDTCLVTYAQPGTTTAYTLRVKSLLTGCESDSTTLNTLSSALVVVVPRPIADAGPDTTICEGDSAQLYGMVTGAGPLYTHAWAPGAGMSDPARIDPKASPAYTTPYYLVTTSNGCESIADTILVMVRPVPIISAGNVRNLCLGDSVQLNGQVQQGIAQAYTWTPSVGLNDSTLLKPLASPQDTTTYILRAWNGPCPSLPASVQVLVHPVPLVQAGPDTFLCADGNGIQLQGNYTGGSFPHTLTWSPQIGLTPGNVLNPLCNPPQTQVYYLTVSSGSGITFCEATDSVLITVYPSLNLQLAADTQIICPGKSVTLSSSAGVGNATFLWSPSNGIQSQGASTTLASPDSSVTYILTASEGFCSDSDSVHIQVHPRPVSDFTLSNPEGCNPWPVQFSSLSSNTIAHRWNFGDGSGLSNEVNPKHIFTAPGTYLVELTVMGVGACSDTLLKQIPVQILPTPEIVVTSDPAPPVEISYPLTQAIRLEASANREVSWWWSLGDGSASQASALSHTYQMPGTYYVDIQAKSEDGCLVRQRLGPYQVVSSDLFIPNVFTPNGDGLNDLFLIQYKGDEAFMVKIYDRWGVTCFETRNTKQGWDGLDLNGNPVRDGVYFYRVDIGGASWNGSISLLR